MKRSLSLVTLCVASLFGGFAHGTPAAALSPYANASGIDRGGFDDTVRPQDDFFDYVNGGWIAATEIPPDRAWWGVVPELRAESEARQRAIIEEMAARSDLGPDSVARKIGAFFASLTDQSLVEGKGVIPIEDTLARIAAIDSGESLAAAFGAAQLLGIDAPLAVGVLQDPGAADRYVPYLWQSGIALPDRDYYLRDDEKFRKIRAAYPGYIAKLLGLGGFGGTPEQGQAVYAIEQRLAELHWPAEENRDMKKLFNMVPAAQLAAVAPDFAWSQYIDAAGLGARPELMAAQLSYVKQIGAIVAEFPLEAWKDYLRYHALNSAAPWLSGEFEQANFEFMQREVLGLAELAPQWKRAVRAIDALAGEAVGQVYVERYFPEGHKQAMLGLVGNLLEAFRTGITELEWMSPETRAKAEAKRALLATKIGYPDKWRDYSGLEIRADDPLGNLARASAFEYRYELAKLDQPIDRAEWSMTPQTVNAYHQPFMNEIVFPAGFLQPPNFNMAADPAVNYGAIGYVIGHEIGHAFDDKGRAFDPYGKLQDWWSAADAEHFEQAAAKLVEQYNAFRPLPDMSINGKLTLGENIADLTGITIAYRAYRASLGGKEAPVIDGLSGDQRFFIGFAQANRAQHARGDAALDAGQRSALAGALSRTRGAAQLHALLRRLRREGRRRHVPAARRTREDLVRLAPPCSL
jgi:putative endopeptidase